MTNQITTPAPPGKAPPPVRPREPRARQPSMLGFVVGSLVAVLAAVAVVAVLLVWAPWASGAPAVPTNVDTSATAVSATITWNPGTGGTDVERYVVIRDGADVAALPAATTVFRDAGLSPGTPYEYQVAAVASGERSDPTALVTVTTLAPSPVDVSATPSAGGITVRWSAPPSAPQPDGYVVLRDGARVATVLGSTTAYEDTNASDGTYHVYRVLATWDGTPSVLSSEVTAASAG